MKKRFVIFALLMPFVLFYGCDDDKKDENAKAYLMKARTSFHNGKYDEAFRMIDSIRVVSPKSFRQIKEGEYLTDSITRKINSLKIDSLSAVINGYKREMYMEMTESDNHEEIRMKWTQKIDSVEKLKKAPFSIVYEIYGKESKRASECQCVTIMRQR